MTKWMPALNAMAQLVVLRRLGVCPAAGVGGVVNAVSSMGIKITPQGVGSFT